MWYIHIYIYIYKVYIIYPMNYIRYYAIYVRGYAYLNKENIIYFMTFIYICQYTNVW